MSNMLRHIMGALLGLLFLTTAAMAQQQVNLTPYLQAEVNEAAVLRAQANYLQQQGDPLGAAVMASFIPDHQMQIDRLSAVMLSAGGYPSTVQPNVTPTLGTRQQIFQSALEMHTQAIDRYRGLANATNNNVYDQLALLGQNRAMRHAQSLRMANGSTAWTPTSLIDATTAALALERGMVNDLQIQANALAALGDQATAQVLLGMVPQHQQQAANLEVSLRQLGGDPAHAVPAPVVALTTRQAILDHFKTANTQMINTYAIAISTMPPGPLRQTLTAGQTQVLTSLASLQRLPIA